MHVLTNLVTPTLEPHRKYVMHMHYCYDRNGPGFHQTHITRTSLTLLIIKTPHVASPVMVLLPQPPLQTIQAAARINHLTGHRPAPLGEAHVFILT